MRKLQENSVVRLKDGRIGTILAVSQEIPDLYLVEIDNDTYDRLGIHADEIDVVEWEP